VRACVLALEVRGRMCACVRAREPYCCLLHAFMQEEQTWPAIAWRVQWGATRDPARVAIFEPRTHPRSAEFPQRSTGRWYQCLVWFSVSFKGPLLCVSHLLRDHPHCRPKELEQLSAAPLPSPFITAHRTWPPPNDLTNWHPCVTRASPLIHDLATHNGCSTWQHSLTWMSRNYKHIREQNRLTQ